MQIQIERILRCVKMNIEKTQALKRIVNYMVSDLKVMKTQIANIDAKTNDETANTAVMTHQGVAPRHRHKPRMVSVNHASWNAEPSASTSTSKQSHMDDMETSFGGHTNLFI